MCCDFDISFKNVVTVFSSPKRCYVPRTRYCVTLWVVFLMLWPDIIQFGRVTSDVIIGMSVTDFTTAGHIASDA